MKPWRLLSEDEAVIVINTPRSRRVNQDLAKRFRVTLNAVRACRIGTTFKYLTRPSKSKT